MPLQADELLTLILGQVQAELVPRRMPADEFAGIVAPLRSKWLEALADKVNKLPWGGYVRKDEREHWRGVLVRFDARAVPVRVKSLERGGFQVRLDGCKAPVRAAELALVGVPWHELSATAAAAAAQAFAAARGEPRPAPRVEDELLHVMRDDLMAGGYELFVRDHSLLIGADGIYHATFFSAPSNFSGPDSRRLLIAPNLSEPRRRLLEQGVGAAFAAARMPATHGKRLPDDPTANLLRGMAALERAIEAMAVNEALRYFAGGVRYTLARQAQAKFETRSDGGRHYQTHATPAAVAAAVAQAVGLEQVVFLADQWAAERAQGVFTTAGADATSVAKKRGGTKTTSARPKSTAVDHRNFEWTEGGFVPRDPVAADTRLVKVVDDVDLDSAANSPVHDAPALVERGAGPPARAVDEGSATSGTGDAVARAVDTSVRPADAPLPGLRKWQPRPAPRPKTHSGQMDHAELPVFWRNFRDIFGTNFPYHLDFVRQNSDGTCLTLALIDEKTGAAVGWIDLRNDEYDVEWSDASLRPGERQRIEAQLESAMRVAEATRFEVAHEDEDDIEDGAVAPLRVQVDLIAARTRHLRERAAPHSFELDQARRALAPLLHGLDDPRNEPSRTPTGATIILAQQELFESSSSTTRFLSGFKTPKTVNQFLQDTQTEILSVKDFTHPRPNDRCVLIDLAGIRTRDGMDYIVAADGLDKPLRTIELPDEDRASSTADHKCFRVSAEGLGLTEDALVYDHREDEKALRDLHQAFGDLATWLRVAPPTLDPVRRGLRVAGSLIDTYGCRGPSRIALLDEFRRARADYDLAVVAAVDDPDGPARERAQERAETTMLRVLASAQTCAEGQQDLQFVAPQAPRRAGDGALKLSMQAETLPEAIEVRGGYFADRFIVLEDDEVRVTYVGEPHGSDAKPPQLRLFLRPRDEDRVDVCGQLVDGQDLVTASFPWFISARRDLGAINSDWLAARFSGPTSARTVAGLLVADEYGDQAVPISEQNPAVLAQLAAVVGELQRNYRVRPLRSGHGFRLVELATKDGLDVGKGRLIPAGVPLAEVKLKTLPPLPGDVDRTPMLAYLRENGIRDITTTLTAAMLDAISAAYTRASSSRRRAGGSR